MSSRVYIILLNWNAWQDTIECLESLDHLDADNFSVVVCDNLSHDDSYAHLRRWASERCRRLSTAAAAGSGYAQGNFAEWAEGQQLPERRYHAGLVLIQTGANLGFAGGCNVGLRYALQCADADYLWLLNNDTVVDPGSLRAQLEKMARSPQIGILGSKLVDYRDRRTVQCRGGYGFNFWMARVRPVRQRPLPPHASLQQEEAAVEAQLRYVSGASMFVRRSFVEQVGLLNEQYFLYYEELDWIIRAGGRFPLGYCAASVVYHKEGQSIGSSSDRTRRSLGSERFLTRNRVLFIKTYLPIRLPITVGWICIAALHRSLLGHFALARTMLRSIREGLTAKIGQAPGPAR